MFYSRRNWITLGPVLIFLAFTPSSYASKDDNKSSAKKHKKAHPVIDLDLNLPDSDCGSLAESLTSLGSPELGSILHRSVSALSDPGGWSSLELSPPHGIQAQVTPPISRKRRPCSPTLGADEQEFKGYMEANPPHRTIAPPMPRLAAFAEDHPELYIAGMENHEPSDSSALISELARTLEQLVLSDFEADHESWGPGAWSEHALALAMALSSFFRYSTLAIQDTVQFLPMVDRIWYGSFFETALHASLSTAANFMHENLYQSLDPSHRRGFQMQAAAELRRIQEDLAESASREIHRYQLNSVQRQEHFLPLLIPNAKERGPDPVYDPNEWEPIRQQARLAYRLAERTILKRELHNMLRDPENSLVMQSYAVAMQSMRINSIQNSPFSSYGSWREFIEEQVKEFQAYELAIRRPESRSITHQAFFNLLIFEPLEHIAKILLVIKALEEDKSVEDASLKSKKE